MGIDIRRAPLMREVPVKAEQLALVQQIVRRPKEAVLVKAAPPLSFVLVTLGVCMGGVAAIVALRPDLPVVQAALRLMSFGGA